MSDFEIFMVLLGLINLMISFVEVTIALLVLLRKRNDK